MTNQIMPYERTVSKLPDYPQSYTFPDDENIHEAEYISVMTNSYLSKMPLAEAMWTRFDVPINDEDHERIKRLLVAMGWLDHFIDEAPAKEEALTSYNVMLTSISKGKLSLEAPKWARPELTLSVRLLANALKPLPSDEVNGIVNSALRIGEISKEKAAIKSVTEYVAILTEEGALSSDLAVEVINSDLKTTKGYEKLHAFNRTAMIGATLLDAMLDLKDDHEQGLTSVLPTFRNKLYIFNKGARYIPKVAKGLGVSGVRSALKVGLN